MLNMKRFLILLAFLIQPFNLNAQSNKDIPHPLGNQENAYLYGFVGSFLDEIELDEKEYWKNQKKDVHRPTATELFQKEKQDNEDDPTRKPRIADMQEGEMARILEVMLLQNKAYVMVTLYDPDGVGITSCTNKPYLAISFKGRPEAMTLGFLTPEILTGPKMYRYKNGKTAMADPKIYTYKENGKTYKEYILVLYRDDDRKDGQYLTNRDKLYFTSQDNYKAKNPHIVGYMSYIVDTSISSADIRD
jgi:hypothetical protein